MCYHVYLSTTSDADLALYNTDFVAFARVNASNQDSGGAPGKEVVDLLGFENTWYVGSRSGCSCTFRHLPAVELGFGEPADWYPEDEDSLAATRELHKAIADLIGSGHQVDIVDRWWGTPLSEIKTKNVNFSEISEAEFRLFENHLFRFMALDDPGKEATNIDANGP
jgi:hypothetical protein